MIKKNKVIFKSVLLVLLCFFGLTCFSFANPLLTNVNSNTWVVKFNNGNEYTLNYPYVVVKNTQAYGSNQPFHTTGSGAIHAKDTYGYVKDNGVTANGLSKGSTDLFITSVLASTQDIININTGQVVFQKPHWSKYLPMGGALDQILTILPIILGLLIFGIGLKKGLTLLGQMLKGF